MPTDYYVLRSTKLAQPQYLLSFRFGVTRWGTLEETIAPDSHIHLKTLSGLSKAQIFLANNKELCDPDTTTICRVVVGAESVSYETYIP